jgi:hypothetical protein
MVLLHPRKGVVVVAWLWEITMERLWQGHPIFSAAIYLEDAEEQ